MCLHPFAETTLAIVTNVAGRDTKNKLWTNRLMWMGLGFAFLINSLNSLHEYFSVVPAITIFDRMDGLPELSTFVSNPVWKRALHLNPPLRPNLYPPYIAIAYVVLSNQVTFSIWFVYLFHRIVVLGIQSALGVLPSDSWAERPYHFVQANGAFVALALMSLWYAREHIREIFASAFSGKASADKDEIMSARVAVIGGALGLLFLIAFSSYFMLASIPVAIAFFFLFLTTMITTVRCRAQGGIPQRTIGADFILTIGAPIGYGRLTQGDVYFMGKSYILSGETFLQSAAPVAMEQYKMSEEVGMKKSSMTIALLIAVAFAAVVSMVLGLPQIHKEGALLATQHYSNNLHIHARGIMQRWAEDWAEPNVKAVTSFVIGFAAVIVASLLNTAFAWWPIHPLGVAVMTSARTQLIWFPFMVAWFLKMLTFRYGGLRLYRQICPLFYGIIIGYGISQVFWTLAAFVIQGVLV